MLLKIYVTVDKGNYMQGRHNSCDFLLFTLLCFNASYGGWKFASNVYCKGKKIRTQLRQKR